MTDNTIISKTFTDGLLEFGMGLGMGVLLDTIAPAPDTDKSWQSTAIEVAVQVGVQAVLLQTAGSFVLRRVSPDNSSTGFMLASGLYHGQPNLGDKIRMVTAQLKVGALAFINQDAGMAAKVAPKDA